MVESTTITTSPKAAFSSQTQDSESVTPFTEEIASHRHASIKPYLSQYKVNEKMGREYFSIAPMVDVSDKYFRYFMRLLTKHSFLYTEMINENAVLNACQGRERLLSFSENQHPVVLQIGGNDPVKMGQAAKVGQDWGYDEINVNCGCPSNKVVGGCFGALLMYDPELVARITAEMQRQVTIPVTVKCRLGVDDYDKWEHIVKFIKIVSEQGGVTKFIIHARKAFLKGLDPKQNRTIPPLKYDWVFNLKKIYPHLNFVINGGFSDVKKVQHILRTDNEYRLEHDKNNGLEGCMSGRMAMNNPWDVAAVDRDVYGDTSPTMTREDIIKDFAAFVQSEQDKDSNKGFKMSNNVLVKPLINIFSGEYAGIQWRKIMYSEAQKKANEGQIEKAVLDALEQFREVNPEALESRNGEKVIRPKWQLEQMEKSKIAFLKKQEESKIKEPEKDLSKADIETTQADESTPSVKADGEESKSQPL